MKHASEPSVTELLSHHSALCSLIPGFAVRPEQQQMAQAVDNTLKAKGILLCEAGTGVGKTFAYLIPALLSRQKIIISTGTKNLQDQLFERDLPLIAKALNLPVKTALLKGRANYLCSHRLKSFSEEGQFLSREVVHELQVVRSWSLATKHGDIAEIADLPEQSSVWPYVTSSADNCLGQECAFFDSCFVLKARRIAQQADIVIVNHHLFFADHVLREEGFGELLPGAAAVIFDEAHQLPAVASQFFGENLTSRQLLELAHDSETEYFRVVHDAKVIHSACAALEQAVRSLQQAFGNIAMRVTWQEIASKAEIQQGIAQTLQALAELQTALEKHASRDKALDSCWKRSVELHNKFTVMTAITHQDYIHWFENRIRSFSFHLTPFDIATPFQSILKQTESAWIFTSATLTMGKDFSHFAKQLGLQNAEQLLLTSPFNYQQQALLYIPINMPEPNDREYLTAVIRAAIPVLKASGGRAFFLFTSHKALQLAGNLLAEVLPDFILFIQGDMPKTKLLNTFRKTNRAILLGTYSFWEGVDVKGDALSCVIIDKLPFASPDDPVLKARVNSIKQQGKNAFYEYQLPHAVISLKQGAGRLIRDANDTGVLMICDPRLLHSSYGKYFLQSLPPMPIVREVTAVQKFFATPIEEQHELQNSSD